MKMEQIERSETSAYKIQTPGNHPEENIQHTEHGESLKPLLLYFPDDYMITTSISSYLKFLLKTGPYFGPGQGQGNTLQGRYFLRPS
jgi:hypothetical protein